MSDLSNRVCRIAVLASGNGSNLQALIDACSKNEIKGEIVVVVSSTKHAYALARAREAHIPTLVFDPTKFKTRTQLCAEMVAALKEKEVDLICLAGYMLKVEPVMIRAYPRKIINVHPALLPKYGGKGMYGRHVHAAVLENKESESGCTIHVVDEIFDHGPILAQSKVKVEPNDTPDSLAERIHPFEHALYVSVVKQICEGKINLEEAA